MILDKLREIKETYEEVQRSLNKAVGEAEEAYEDWRSSEREGNRRLE